MGGPFSQFSSTNIFRPPLRRKCLTTATTNRTGVLPLTERIARAVAGPSSCAMLCIALSRLEGNQTARGGAVPRHLGERCSSGKRRLRTIARLFNYRDFDVFVGRHCRNDSQMPAAAVSSTASPTQRHRAKPTPRLALSQRKGVPAGPRPGLPVRRLGRHFPSVQTGAMKGRCWSKSKHGRISVLRRQ